MPSYHNDFVVEYIATTTVKSPMKFPYYAIGEVVKGFGRGSKQLGIPTANFSRNSC